MTPADPLTRVGLVGLYGDRFFDIVDPKPELIDILDIASALSKVCRFGGHVREFYSVAQHSVLCAQLASPAAKRHALLHDAAEAYIGDLVRPLKYIPEIYEQYSQLESKLESVIYERFGLDPVAPPEVKEIDDRVVQHEAFYLMGQPFWSKPIHDLGMFTWGCEHAASMFRRTFYDLWPNWNLSSKSYGTAAK